MTTTKNPPVKQAKYMQAVNHAEYPDGTPTVDILLRRYHQLKTKFVKRNEVYLHLLRVYQSDPAAHGMTGGTDQMEMVVNRIFDTVNTFVDFMGIPPNIHFIPPDLTDVASEYADAMEKYLYATYDENDMEIQWPKITFDQALCGTGNMGVLPRKELDGFVHFRRFTPVNFYPQTIAGTDRIKYYFYEQKTSREEVIEKYGSRALDGAGGREGWKIIWPDGTLNPDEAVVNEYCDEQFLLIMVMDKIVDVVKHDFSFCPAVQFPNIIVPDRVGGMSSVSTYEMLQRYESELFSIIADILSYWADPMLVVEGIDESQVNLGGVTALPKGGNARFVVPELNTNVIAEQMKRTSDVFHDGTIPDTLYGRFESGNLGSKPVLSGLQSKFMVRINGLYRRNGRNLARLNEMALRIAKKVYSKKKITASGWRKNRAFHLDMPGSKIGEYVKHRVFWDLAALDPDRHVITQLQIAGARLQSEETTMEHLGLSPIDEKERIRKEDIYKIKKKAAEAAEQQRLTNRFAKPEREQGAGVNQIRRDSMRASKGGAVYPAGGEQRPGPGRPGSETVPSTRPAAASGSAAAPIIADLKAIRRLDGEVYLIRVGPKIDLAITDKRDKGNIVNAPSMKKYKGRIVFVMIQPGEAQEGWVKIA